MSDLPIVLRPAWRTHWVLILFVVLLIAVAIFASVTDTYPISDFPEVLWGLAAVAVVVLVYRRFLWRFEVDETRIKTHRGIVSRNQQSVRLKDLRSIELRQSIFQRLFNVGNMAFYTAGSAEAEVHFHGVKNPIAVRDRIKQIMDAEV